MDPTSVRRLVYAAGGNSAVAEARSETEPLGDVGVRRVVVEGECVGAEKLVDSSPVPS